MTCGMDSVTFFCELLSFSLSNLADLMKNLSKKINEVYKFSKLLFLGNGPYYGLYIVKTLSLCFGIACANRG